MEEVEMKDLVRTAVKAAMEEVGTKTLVQLPARKEAHIRVVKNGFVVTPGWGPMGVIEEVYCADIDHAVAELKAMLLG